MKKQESPGFSRGEHVNTTCPHCQRPAHDGLLCHACMRQARSDLTNLPWLYLEVRRTAVGLARLTESGPGKSAEKPLPVNLHASKVADRIHVQRLGKRAATITPKSHSMTDAVAKNPEIRKVMEAMTPLGRMGQAEEIAGAVLWLCSDAASFITGHPLVIDGGATVS